MMDHKYTPKEEKYVPSVTQSYVEPNLFDKPEVNIHNVDHKSEIHHSTYSTPYKDNTINPSKVDIDDIYSEDDGWYDVPMDEDFDVNNDIDYRSTISENTFYSLPSNLASERSDVSQYASERSDSEENITYKDSIITEMNNANYTKDKMFLNFADPPIKINLGDQPIKINLGVGSKSGPSPVHFNTKPFFNTPNTPSLAQSNFVVKPTVKLNFKENYETFSDNHQSFFDHAQNQPTTTTTEKPQAITEEPFNVPEQLTKPIIKKHRFSPTVGSRQVHQMPENPPVLPTVRANPPAIVVTMPPVGYLPELPLQTLFQEESALINKQQNRVEEFSGNT